MIEDTRREGLSNWFGQGPSTGWLLSAFVACVITFYSLQSQVTQNTRDIADNKTVRDYNSAQIATLKETQAVYGANMINIERNMVKIERLLEEIRHAVIADKLPSYNTGPR